MQFINEKRNRFVLLAGILIGAALLTGCGGGNKACSTVEKLSITGTAYPVGTIRARLGVAITPMTPILAGIPASCQGEKYFEVSSLPSSKLPAGLTLDARTGTISGTPTALSETVSLGGLGIQTPLPTSASINLQLPGYSEIQLGLVTFTVTK